VLSGALMRRQTTLSLHCYRFHSFRLQSCVIKQTTL